MKVKAVRLYGKSDLRFEEFELRDMKEDEILAKVNTDSLCMSSYKAMLQGSDHRAIPEGIDQDPIIIGHELCATVVAVGSKVEGGWKPGDTFTCQPKMYFDGVICAPGYSYPTYGGDATYIVIPGEVMRDQYLLPYSGEALFKASLAEPFSCLVSALHSQYHLMPNHKDHKMGVQEGGHMAILAGCGPMGIGLAELAMSMEKKPGKIVVTDINEARVERAKELLKGKNGVEIEVVNTGAMEDTAGFLKGLTGGKGFDDVIVMAPVPGVIELADAITGVDSCISFFAGPTVKDFYAKVNFYDVHYNYKHIMGTSGGDIDDMREALALIEKDEVRAEVMVSHVGGLDAAAEATLNLPKIPGAKKLIYCQLSMPLTAIADFGELGKTDPLFAALDEICRCHNGLWSAEAEVYLMKHGKSIMD